MATAAPVATLGILPAAAVCPSAEAPWYERLHGRSVKDRLAHGTEDSVDGAAGSHRRRRVTSAGGFFLIGAVFGAHGYVAAAIPTIAFFLLTPLMLLGALDGPGTSDGQVGLVPLSLSLYAAALVAAGHAVRQLWLGARRLRRWTVRKRKPEKPLGPIR
jgi:hypothetical protein